MVIGKEVHEKLMNSKTFMVGAGALGCEYLKGFAMIGLGCGQGQVTVTDDDTIEVSNLNRQFLFRKNNVGGYKSECASAAAKLMNPSLNVVPSKDRVSPEHEHI